MLNKITVVGAGNVGATVAQRLAEQELARTVVMVDVVEGLPQGKALDQWQSGPIEGFDTRVVGANDYGVAAGSELVVVTAGIARKPGMSRDDLARTNAGIVKQVAQQLKQHCSQAIVVVVSNPLDVMCWVTKQVTGFPRERVIGMAGVLDTARFRAFLADAVRVSVEDIDAMAYAGRRRRDRGSFEDGVGVLRAVRRRRADGGGDRARQAPAASLRRVGRGRVRPLGNVRGRALQARARGARADRRDRARGG